MAVPAVKTAMRAILSHATPEEIPDIVDFTKTARASMFPMIDTTSQSRQAERELATFQQTYLDHSDGAFITARAGGILVATIAYVPYDYRFPQLDVKQGRVVEVVRLYVDPAFRRTGLASRLFAALEETARQEGIEHLYLHTHPFLLGAITFWEKHGFSTILVEQDPVWHTTHMKLPLDGTRHVSKAQVQVLI